MTISEARKEVFEYLTVTGKHSQFTTALQTLYDETLKNEARIDSLKNEVKAIKYNSDDFFHYINNKCPDVTKQYFEV